MKLVLFQTGETATLHGHVDRPRRRRYFGSVPAQLYAAARHGRHHRRLRRLRPALEQARPDARRSRCRRCACARRCRGRSKILACIANYWEHAQREPRPLNMFMKNPDAVIGPGDTIVLPEFTEPWIFMHEAELALVIKGPAKMVKRENWRERRLRLHRHDRRVGARRGPAHLGSAESWLGKSFDTFAPIGPCIATADEIAEPQRRARAVLERRPAPPQLQHRRHGAPRARAGRVRDHDHDPHSGDLIACGTNHEGLGPLQDGEAVEFEIHGIGRMRSRSRSAQAHVGARHLHGCRLDHPKPSSATVRGTRRRFAVEKHHESRRSQSQAAIPHAARLRRVARPAQRAERQAEPSGQPDQSGHRGHGADRWTALAELLPPDCTLDGEPLLTVSMTFMSNIGWLAGRGYSIFDVEFPHRA